MEKLTIENLLPLILRVGLLMGREKRRQAVKVRPIIRGRGRPVDEPASASTSRLVHDQEEEIRRKS
jgi:hypothetical protein